MAKERTTKDRLAEYIHQTGMQQIDILRKAEPFCKKYNKKLTKSDLSQYCSGKTEPHQDKLYILSLAMNVNVAWLMGFDVPMSAQVSPQQEGEYYDRFTDETANLEQLVRNDEKLSKALIEYFRLSDEEKQHVIDTIYLLSRKG